MDIIEHTSNPDQFINSVLRILSDDGILLITTGDSANSIWQKVNGAFWYCTYAEHISFISEQWLQLNSGVNKFRIAHLQRFKYENRNRLKTVAKLCLIHLYRFFGWQPKSSWTAHVSMDHIFAVIRR